MPNVLSPRDLVSRPDNINETVLSSHCALIVDQLANLHFISPLVLCSHVTYRLALVLFHTLWNHLRILEAGCHLKKKDFKWNMR